MDVRPEVKLFAEAMEAQLQKNEHKGDWKDCDPYFLFGELERNFHRLSWLNRKSPGEDILRRTANVANFAMMIADVCGALGRGENDQPRCATQYGAIDYDTEEEAIAGWNRRSGGWISVAERLPEEGEFLLGWHEEGLVVLTTNMFDELENVTHWMPLPEPPEGAEK